MTKEEITMLCSNIDKYPSHFFEAIIKTTAHRTVLARTFAFHSDTLYFYEANGTHGILTVNHIVKVEFIPTGMFDIGFIK